MAKPVAGNLETFLVGYVLGEHENVSQISSGKLAALHSSQLMVADNRRQKFPS
jgi:hypothetical protein